MTTLHSEFIPATDPTSRRLMVMLHGLGDSLEGYRWFPGALNLPGLNYLLVNAPDDYYGGWSWFDIADLGPPRRIFAAASSSSPCSTICGLKISRPTRSLSAVFPRAAS